MGLAHFAFYPRDYLADIDVCRMTLEEQGAYVRLLALMWQAEAGACAIPDDDALIAKLLGVDPRVWRRLRPAIMTALEVEGGCLVSRRLRIEWQRAHKALTRTTQARETRRQKQTAAGTSHQTPADLRDKFAGSSPEVGLKLSEPETAEKATPAEVRPIFGGSSGEVGPEFDKVSAKTKGNSPSDRPENQNQKKKRRNVGERPPTVLGFREFTDAFTAGYRRLTGESPSWGKKQGQQTKLLLSKQPLEVLLRRLDVFFGPNCPDWIARGGRDLGSFLQHLDKLAGQMPSRASPLEAARANLDPNRGYA